MRVAVQVVLSAEERAELEKLSRGRKAPTRVVERARIVLFAAEASKIGKLRDSAQSRAGLRIFGAVGLSRSESPAS